MTIGRVLALRVGSLVAAVALTSVAGLSAASAEPLFGNAETVDAANANSIDTALQLEVGAIEKPSRYELTVDALPGDSIDDVVVIEVDIPKGQRLHASYTLAPDSASPSAQVSADLIDEDGFYSDFDLISSDNQNVSATGVRSGFLISDTMDPSNRSFDKKTYLRLNPSVLDAEETFSVSLTLVNIPEVVDGGGLADIDRPKLRFGEDIVAVDDESALKTVSNTIAAGQTQFIEMELGWLQAVDATVSITRPGSGDGALSFTMFNPIDEMLVVVGQTRLADDAGSNESATFGQRTPVHYGNQTARYKARTTGFMNGHVLVGVTYEADEGEVSYAMNLALSGEGLPADVSDPVYDADAAAAKADEEEFVNDQEYYAAPGFDEEDLSQWWKNPWLGLAAALLVAAVVVAGFAARR